VTRTRRGWPTLAAGVAACAAVGAASFTHPGAAAVGACYEFLEYYSGVFCLVALSLTVMGGIAATDRYILLVRHRVLLQAVHRATALAAVGFLGCHIALKVFEAHAGLLDVAVPFLATRRTAYLGLGTVASHLMVASAWTGAVRARFAESSRPWLWRWVHGSAYAAWPLAIIHGLASGRHAAGWVTASYAVCLILVGLAMLVRLTVAWGRRQRTPRARTTAAVGGMAFAAPTRQAGAVHVVPPHAAADLVRASPPPVSPSPAPRPPAPPPMSPSPAAWSFAGSPPAPPPPGAPLPESPRPRTPQPPAPPPISAPPAGTTRPAPPPTPQPAPPPPPKPRRSMEHASDAEFWAYMRGETPP
jgi:hypothetical protein